ncbi:hypothetical protein BU14_1403s0001, partial [Porphyra umbilicalis]
MTAAVFPTPRGARRPAPRCPSMRGGRASHAQGWRPAGANKNGRQPANVGSRTIMMTGGARRTLRRWQTTEPPYDNTHRHATGKLSNVPPTTVAARPSRFFPKLYNAPTPTGSARAATPPLPPAPPPLISSPAGGGPATPPPPHGGDPPHARHAEPRHPPPGADAKQRGGKHRPRAGPRHDSGVDPPLDAPLGVPPDLPRGHALERRAADGGGHANDQRRVHPPAARRDSVQHKVHRVERIGAEDGGPLPDHPHRGGREEALRHEEAHADGGEEGARLGGAPPVPRGSVEEKDGRHPRRGGGVEGGGGGEEGERGRGSNDAEGGQG